MLAITPRTGSSDVKAVAIVDIFTRFTREVSVPDERAQTSEDFLIDNRIYLALWKH